MRDLRPLLFTTLACLLGSVLPTAPAGAEGPRSVRTDLHGLQESGVIGVAQDESVRTIAVGPEVRAERLVATRGGWLLTATRDTRETPAALVLWTEDSSGNLRELPTPATAGRELRDPIPLLDRAGSLDGLVWLEGADPESLAIHHAAWTGAAWQEPVQLVGPGPGSQLALDGITLGDGSHLLVWARYDGDDDEIVWSRLDHEGFTEPRRVQPDNAVPDITPALVETDRGVLLAWSQYDGNDYRLRLARLVDGEWRLESTLPARGGVFPSWQRTPAGDLHLVYRNGAESAWNVARVDGLGRLLGFTTIAGSSDDLPRIEVRDGETTAVFPSGRAVELDWRPVPRLP